MEEVSRLFQDEGDKQALELLYEITKDEIAKIALGWLNKYEQEIDSSIPTTAWEMYDDLIAYLYSKYKL